MKKGEQKETVSWHELNRSLKANKFISKGMARVLSVCWRGHHHRSFGLLRRSDLTCRHISTPAFKTTEDTNERQQSRVLGSRLLHGRRRYWQAFLFGRERYRKIPSLDDRHYIDFILGCRLCRTVSCVDRPARLCP